MNKRQSIPKSPAMFGVALEGVAEDAAEAEAPAVSAAWATGIIMWNIYVIICMICMNLIF
jgi:hypothetical protein